jgi:ubiquinol-cytochrome c reductase cytochrome c1 subunit
MLRPISALALVMALGFAPAAMASGTVHHPKEVSFSFDGPFGKFDQEQLQRGYKVYREVCSSCHSAKLVSFRNLGDKGGPFWNPEFPNSNDNPVVKAIAADYQVDDIDSETGDTVKRPGVPADRFPSPYPNLAAAKAGNNGAAPPDMSVLSKARHGGAAYIYSILTGYGEKAPAHITINPGQYYNPYMNGGVIAMPPPLVADKVSFDDGTKSTLDQQAKDVSAFLAWAAEPKMEERKSAGFAVMIYLVLLAGLLYASYKSVWRNESH